MKAASTAFLILAIAAGLAACGGNEAEDRSDGVFDQEDFPFTFEYPDGFREASEPR